MSVKRDKVWHLLHPDPELEALDLRLDLLDAQIHDERLLQYQATRQRLEELGFDVSKFRPPPRPSRAEQRTTSHIRQGEDIEALVTEAQRSELDKLYEQHVASRTTAEETHTPAVLRRYFPTTFTIR